VKSTENGQRQVRVWDLPTRLVHWLLVALVAFSWWSAENAPIEWHMRSGLAILALLLFRILWGFFGSSTARFANFVRGPRAVIDYLSGSWNGVGHNPLGAFSVIALLLALAVQVTTGLVQIDSTDFVEGPLSHLVSFETAEAAHEVHEFTFNVLLGLIGLHVAAILLYRLLLGKRLVAPMITGKAAIDADTEPMRPGKWWVALLCLAIALAVSWWVASGAPRPAALLATISASFLR
jgi:cytochrome b